MGAWEGEVRDSIKPHWRTVPECIVSAPESIADSDRWHELLMEQPLCDQIIAIVVDEAHCVYKWSKDFRPSYAKVHELRAFISSGVPMMATTLLS